jgi:superfamily I DNA/RNA helicase
VKQQIILGPPGTGKTTKCISIVEQEIASGVRPDNILFTTFTRKGANEAILRACEKFHYRRDDLPYFRTIHSLCFQQLNLSKEDVMGFQDYRKLGLALGIEFGYIDLSEGMAAPTQNIGDQMLYVLGLARAKMITEKEQFDEIDFDFSWLEFKRFLDTLAAYKEQKGLLDFSDMLDRYIADGMPLNIKAAIIDEAQDLSIQQWKVIEKATANCERRYIAGDDDQSIFTWSGADVNSFLDLKGEQVVLDRSFRLPSVIHSYADKISKRISKRYSKKWSPNCDGGSINFINHISEIDIHDGSCLMLARNKYLLRQFEEVLRMGGYPYTTHRGSSIDKTMVMAIKVWEALRSGKSMDVSLIRPCYALLQVGVGVARGKKSLHGATGVLTMAELKMDWGLLTDSIWHEALAEMPDIPYYLAALRRGEKLDKMPRIHVSTVHTVKGGEADNVIIISDVSYKTYQHIDDDDENRIAYVAVTRARKTLQIVLPQTKFSYDYP